MQYEKYLIKKDKTDLLSSLKALDKKIIKKRLRAYELKSIKELKNYIIDNFIDCLSFSKDDIFTQMYFKRLVENENSIFMSVYQEDIEELWAFVYENGNHYSYYIPTEIKKIIKKELNFK